MAGEFDERIARLEERHEQTSGRVQHLIDELAALRQEVSGLRGDLRALTATYEAERRGLRLAGAVVVAAAAFVGWLIGIVVQIWRP